MDPDAAVVSTCVADWIAGSAASKGMLPPAPDRDVPLIRKPAERAACATAWPL